MIDITRNGSIADVIRQVRDIPQSVVPYAAAAALTKLAKDGQRDVISTMSRVFDRPVPYTLNATRIEPATKDKLSARVAVKDRATRNGTLPEDYLFPEVVGGPRKEKRFERSMRLAGLLKPGMRVVLGQEAPQDAYGNLKRGEMQRILTATRSAFDKYQRKSSSVRSQRNARNAPYFVGGLDRISIAGGEQVTKRARIQPGIYRREGRGIKPVLIFVSKQPSYRARLDFDGIVQRSASAEAFADEFSRAAASILARAR